MYVRHLILFLALAAGGCAVDLWTKHWVFEKLGYYQVEGELADSPLVLVDGVFSLETHLNEGALFGIGQGKVFLFVGLSLLAIGGILIWIVFGGAARDRLLTVALGLVLGGILGNLYDRVGWAQMKWSYGVPGHSAGDRVYAVRDWLHFQIQSIGFDWAIFNIADSLLVVGASLLLWHALCHGREPASDTETAATSAEPTSVAAETPAANPG